MSKKIRWIKPIGGGGPPRAAGSIEENDEDLCATWVKAGLAEYVSAQEKTDAEKRAEDLERRRKSVEAPAEDKAVHESPQDKAVRGRKQSR